MAKILITDDSALSRRILSRILTDLNHSVVEATDGYSALEIYNLEKPDFVFLDLNMPDITGPEVLEKLLEIDKNAKVIIATADLQKTTLDPLVEAGALDFINKPFLPEKLKELIDKITGDSK